MPTSVSAILSKSAILLPDEIVFHILQFLNPCSVIQLRLVSKQFNDVTRDTRLWRVLYTNARLPRPSGPFLWQSARFLEHVLIHSARVSHTWTSQPISVVSSTRGPRIPVKPSPISTSSDFLFGRLFIWCEGEQLLAQDLETGIGRLLWEGTEPISSLNACSLTLPNAERVFIALRYIDEPISHRTPIKLLEFPLQDDVRQMLGPVTFEMDLPEYANFPMSASAHFLYFDGGVEHLFGHAYEPIVIDVRTWAIYKFPTFSSGIDAVIHKEPHPWGPSFTLLSAGYIIIFRPWCHWNPPVTLIQAFVAPDTSSYLSDTDAGQLRLTHETLADHCYVPTHRLRGAIVDPATKETNVRFLSTDRHHEQTHYLCVDVTIPPIDSGSTEVLSMSVNAQELVVFSGINRYVFLDASNDGHGRGIITLCTSAPSNPEDHSVVLYKLSIDASAEQCTAVVSEPSKLTSHDILRYSNRAVFDGVRGRVCHDWKVDTDFYDLMVLGLN